MLPNDITVNFFDTSAGKAILALVILVFIFLIVAILVGCIFYCCWRSSSRFKTWYYGRHDGQDIAPIYDSREDLKGRNSWRAHNPLERSVQTQTDLTAVAVLDKSPRSKWDVITAHVNRGAVRSDPVPDDSQSRWSRINPKIYLNPWTYRSTRLSPNVGPANPSMRRIYVDDM